jgi:hypothetical protein
MAGIDRTQFYNILTINGIQEFDFLENTLSFFTMNYPVSYYQVNDSDILRPDIISYKCYNSVDYWWIIMYVNQIQNPFTDLVSGTQLIVPNILDIINFFRQYKLHS